MLGRGARNVLASLATVSARSRRAQRARQQGHGECSVAARATCSSVGDRAAEQVLCRDSSCTRMRLIHLCCYSVVAKCHLSFVHGIKRLLCWCQYWCICTLLVSEAVHVCCTFWIAVNKTFFCWHFLTDTEGERTYSQPGHRQTTTVSC